MVEANVQLLVGAAVTVFLALLFFGVVVLWDVALALRSVGDKIDKLEDNIDDDLTDIGHSLDGMSGGSGGGGTQLHLSGGTISSGPAAQPQGGAAGPQEAGAHQPQQGAPQQPPQHQQAPQHQESTRRQGPAQRPPQGAEAGPHADGEPASPESHHETGPSRPDAGSETVPDGETPDTDGADAVATEPDAADAATGESTADAEAESAAEGDLEPDVEAAATDADGEEAAPTHPAADRNRGRFISSPDRTAWYAVPLDREAIRDAGPSIAGELTDGSVDESEIIAAGPVESAETAAIGDDEPDDRTATPAPPAAGDSDESSPDSSAGSPAETAEVEAGTESDEAAVVAEPDDGTATGDEPDAQRESDGDVGEADAFAFDADEQAVDDGADAESTDGDAADADAFPVDGDTDGAETESAADGTDETDAESTADASAHSATETDLEAVGETDVDTVGTDAVEDDPFEADAAARDDDHQPGETGPEAVEPTAEESADAPSDGFEAPLGDDVAAFEFDEDLDDEDDVTVAEAVDTINEDAPAPELSSHRFDVTAEVYGDEDDGAGDESAVLIFEFDTDTVDITGSTKRLLQYQMRSYADRDSTPDGEVSIGRDRIVIEIADTDGNAVKRWGDAAVGIIDRTLYLSDNSSDGD